MTTVTIYKLHSGFSNIADDWALNDVHVNEFRGDYAATVELPEGFRVARSMGGDLAVYDAANRHYEVTSNEVGNPVLAGGGFEVPLTLVR